MDNPEMHQDSGEQRADRANTVLVPQMELRVFSRQKLIIGVLLWIGCSAGGSFVGYSAGIPVWTIIILVMCGLWAGIGVDLMLTALEAPSDPSGNVSDDVTGASNKDLEEKGSLHN